MRIDTTLSLGDIVTTQPTRARVLEELGLDYCCGGDRSLARACAERGLDATAVIAALEEADRLHQESGETAENWAEAPLDQLVEHIVDWHHAYLRRELPRLGDLMQKVQRAHGARHPELHQVASVLAGLTDEL